MGETKRHLYKHLQESNHPCVPKKHILQNERTRQKKLFKVKNNNVRAKGKRSLLLFCFTHFEQVFVGRVISFIFSSID